MFSIAANIPSASSCPKPPQSWYCRDLCYDVNGSNTCPQRISVESTTNKPSLEPTTIMISSESTPDDISPESKGYDVSQERVITGVSDVTSEVNAVTTEVSVVSTTQEMYPDVTTTKTSTGDITMDETFTESTSNTQESNTQCVCPCSSEKNESELINYVNMLIGQIKINGEETVIAKSRRTSAPDNRGSAKAIGYVASLCNGIPDTIEYDGKCYEFKNTEKSYASAQEFCNGKGGILLEIINGGIENFVYETIGEEIIYKNWLSGETYCFKLLQHLCTANCVIYDFSKKGWNDKECEGEYHYACEYEIPKQQDYVSSKPATIKPGTAITVSDAMKRRSCDCEECTSDIVRSLQNKDDIARKINSLTSILKLDRTTLSKYKNTKVSLGDKRLSAKVLGYTGGGVIVTSILIIIVQDLYKLLCYITTAYKRKL
ncbi:unnamed protein product [Mytilus edulis]|uniref:C-type lectin domain-containing protein n=1 Tax=Mytilus edulis TaxID=6550 RepID=A0A8S3QXU8_MYTED|nr:unnamed protein product [Mytilus edulis]